MNTEEQKLLGCKKIGLFFGVVLFIACQNKDHRAHSSEGDAVAQEQHQKNEAHHGSANAHMHRSSVKELIERFESDERDAYQQPEKVLEYLGDIEGKTIIDIGAGSGYFSVRLAERGARVIAADVDEEFQAFLKKRIEENDLERVETRKIPYDSPGLLEKEADIVFIVNTYHHIENRSDYFSKVKKGTKTDGSLVIVDFFKSDIPVGPPTEHKIALDQVVHELKEAGYTTFEVIVDLLPYQFIIQAK